MRDVKFRAWDKFQQKYVFEGFHICGEVTCFGMMEQVIHETWEARAKAQNYVSTLEAWNDFEFEQFADEIDKNGKDVYDGDRVIVTNKPYKIKQPPIVVWGSKSHGWSLKCAIDDKYVHLKYYALPASKHIEVIGNIHDLPNVI